MGRWLFLACVVWLAGLVTAAAGDGNAKPVKITSSWTGRLTTKDKEALRMSAPTKRYVSGPKAFAALWKMWRTEEKVPDVDFGKKLVLVMTSGGPNEVKLAPTLNAAGDLNVKSTATLVGGPGFGYAFGVIDRTGIKTVQGKPLVQDE